MRSDGVAQMSAAPWVSFADIDVVECNGSSWFVSRSKTGAGGFPAVERRDCCWVVPALEWRVHALFEAGCGSISLSVPAFEWRFLIRF